MAASVSTGTDSLSQGRRRNSYIPAPMGPPTSGPTMYAQKPEDGPGIAIEPHPAKRATSLGPKSRAGFQPPWVSGAKMLIRTATVNPMKKGAKCLVGKLEFRRSTSAKIIRSRMAVPNPSTRAAFTGETRLRASSPVPNIAGLGKYSPKTMAESSLPELPRLTPFTDSNRSINGPKSHKMARPAITAPVNWDIQYGTSLEVGKLPLRKIANARLTAGFRWAPEIAAVA